MLYRLYREDKVNKQPHTLTQLQIFTVFTLNFCCSISQNLSNLLPELAIVDNTDISSLPELTMVG